MLRSEFEDAVIWERKAVQVPNANTARASRRGPMASADALPLERINVADPGTLAGADVTKIWTVVRGRRSLTQAMTP
ncbi:hypothetical protein GOL41_25515 [Sinorhizobium medicae]|uniref:Uncharacterized protein n=1 Tax=Sinorhizobium medicae TaxID=110321 RepID=A0A508WRG6_9HYPH|nr:hypothetical protein [Sinorhizobium medicae]MBO1944832.1 hypothetical protein [Sinorhizobium medicae]MBO1960569.1 hypothetical protein [Sinorhizobium medicae]MDX0436441.1 hypothetical protein [Sinorhizobium medicae]MDX0444864.1 hypothetical protein [Sinorhizobium medicae]MDX0462496.1 hypothetical protein [Sinorhizobium medicae]